MNCKLIKLANHFSPWEFQKCSLKKNVFDQFLRQSFKCVNHLGNLLFFKGKHLYMLKAFPDRVFFLIFLNQRFLRLLIMTKESIQGQMLSDHALFRPFLNSHHIRSWAVGIELCLNCAPNDAIPLQNNILPLLGLKK